jgi:SAM-dependent methyltransferase
VGFAADWLALREPADRAARDEALARRAAATAGTDPLIVDLGCGTGATWRALSPFLPEGARWRFVDKDPELLRRAVEAADAAVEAVEADIDDLAALPLGGATLVTASALLDLVSESWLDALVQRIDMPFYAALSYCGTMRWTPPDPRDDAVTAFFNRHQRGDKGLGPALGPDAADYAARVFAGAGWAVHQADSPWHLGPGMAALQRELTDGIAAAAAEAGIDGAGAWGRHRREVADRTHCEIGHRDLLVLPPSPAAGSVNAAR